MPDVKYTFRGEDRTANTIDRIRRRINSLAGRAVNLVVNVRADGLERVQRQVNDLPSSRTVTVDYRPGDQTGIVDLPDTQTVAVDYKAGDQTGIVDLPNAQAVAVDYKLGEQTGIIDLPDSDTATVDYKPGDQTGIQDLPDTETITVDYKAGDQTGIVDLPDTQTVAVDYKAGDQTGIVDLPDTESITVDYKAGDQTGIVDLPDTQTVTVDYKAGDQTGIQDLPDTETVTVDYTAGDQTGIQDLPDTETVTVDYKPGDQTGIQDLPDSHTVNVSTTLDNSSLEKINSNVASAMRDGFTAGFALIPGTRLPMAAGALGGLGGLGAGGIAGLAGGSLVAGGLAAGTYSAFQAMNLDELTDQVAGAKGITEDSEERARLEKLLIERGMDASRFNVFDFGYMAEILFRNAMPLEMLEAGALRETGMLAEALVQAGGDPAQIAPIAADIITDLQKQFKLTRPEDFANIGNLAAGYTLGSKGTIYDLGGLVAQGGGVAGLAGLSVEDFMTLGTGVMSYFRSGSDAGTSIKQMLMLLANPTGPALASLDEAGLLHSQVYTEKGNIESGISTLFDEEGAMRPMADFLAELQAVSEGMSQAGRLQFFGQVFGSDAARAAAGGAQMADEFISLQEELVSLSAEQLAEIKRGNVAAEWDILTGKLQTGAAQAGEPLADAAQGILQDLNWLIDYELADPDTQRQMMQEEIERNRQERQQGQEAKHAEAIEKASEVYANMMQAGMGHVAAMEQTVGYLAGSTFGGFLGMGGEHLFSEFDAHKIGADIAVAFRENLQASLPPSAELDMSDQLTPLSPAPDEGLDPPAPPAQTRIRSGEAYPGMHVTGRPLPPAHAGLPAGTAYPGQIMMAPGWPAPAGGVPAGMGYPGMHVTGFPPGGPARLSAGWTLDDNLRTPPAAVPPFGMREAAIGGLAHPLPGGRGAPSWGGGVAQGLATGVQLLTDILDTSELEDVPLKAKVTDLDTSAVENQIVQVMASVVINGTVGIDTPNLVGQRIQQDRTTQRRNTVSAATYDAGRQRGGGGGGEVGENFFR